MSAAGGRAPVIGGLLVLIYTGLISGADAITKQLAVGYEAAQLFCLSGALVVGFCLLGGRIAAPGQGVRTTCPRSMLVRSGATVVAAVSFFHAFRLLPFAEVFLFIGLMPLLAGLLSGPILHERVRPICWLALVSGFIGVLCLFPTGFETVSRGHFWALSASFSGTLSLVMARYIGRHENNPLAQVFYPNLAICLSMALAVPFVWKPMPMADLAWVLTYAALLFAARWVVVVALRLLAAFAVTPLMNFQFVWMVLLGVLFFDEVPGANAYAGAAIVIGSGLFIIWDQFTLVPPRPTWIPRTLGKVKVGA